MYSSISHFISAIITPIPLSDPYRSVQSQIQLQMAHVFIKKIFFEITRRFYWGFHKKRIFNSIYFKQISYSFFFKGTDRLCKVVKLSMQWCGQILLRHINFLKICKSWVWAQSRLSKSYVWMDTFLELFFLDNDDKNVIKIRP